MAAHWQNLANATEAPMCGSHAACCQITVTTCFYYSATLVQQNPPVLNWGCSLTCMTAIKQSLLLYYSKVTIIWAPQSGMKRHIREPLGFHLGGLGERRDVNSPSGVRAEPWLSATFSCIHYGDKAIFVLHIVQVCCCGRYSAEARCRTQRSTSTTWPT